MKTVVVTGVSTGIGWATAKVLLAEGFRVFGSVRRETDAARLAAEFGPNFTPLLFDVTDAAAVHAAAERVKQALGGETLFGLVNNAGIAVPGPLLHLKVEDFRHQLDVNLTGQLIAIQAFAPLLDGEKPGRIVMISSVGGKNAAPFVGPYNTSKFGLEGFSESLRREFMLYGIDVIVIAPGAIATPIWDKADALDISPYASTPYAAPLAKIKKEMITRGRKGLPPETIGRAVLKALTAAHPKTRYTITPEPVASFLVNVLPKRWADRLYARMLGLTRSKR
jgi:NAD(P)-dependent dehydrogenase (short-subunit alcohol dehydrogenase family)